jgi:RNA polymerase sigma-70 factor, ECF subfamily
MSVRRVGREHGTSLDAIESAYRRGLPRFRRMAAAVAGSPELGRDAVQEAFATAVRTRGSFRGDGPLEAWLWRAVLNAAKNQRRTADRRYETGVGDGPSPNGTHPNDPSDAVRGALAEMPERQRIALFLRYYADLDYRQIAEVLGVAPGTVGATLSAARANLERLLEEVPT